MTRLAEITSDPPSLPQSIWHVLDATASKHGDDIAITAMHQSADHLAGLFPNSRVQRETRWLSWTYSELRHVAIRLASGLVAGGVKRGSTVATLVPNGIEHVLLFWVAAMLQLTLAPLDPGLVTSGRQEQLRDYLQRLSPDAVVVQDNAGTEAVDMAANACAIDLSTRVSLDGVGQNGWRSLEQLAVASSTPDDSVTEQDAALEQDRERTAAILFTSGTSSGRPKGCPLSTKNLLNACVANVVGIGSFGMRVMIHTVNFRIICLNLAFTAWSRGGQVVLPAATFSPAAVLDAVEQCKADMTVFIPVQVQLLARHPTFAGRNLSSMKHFFIGGDMSMVDVLLKSKDVFPAAHVDTGHGMTEGCGVLGWRYHTTKTVPEHHGILAAGAPTPGTLVRIVDGSGRTLRRGESGELHIGGPSMITRYLDNEQPEAFYRDFYGNWLRTGDRGFIDDSGAVFIIGRIKDIIKKTGVSLSPAVIESVLNAVEGINVAVMGVPSAEYGEVPAAVLKDPYDHEEVKRIVRDKLEPEYALDSVVTLADLGLTEFPINQTGKVVKFMLRDKFLQRQEKQGNSSC
jgi:4-coumarate--CoA ligase